MLEIIIWDIDAHRIMKIESNLCKALKIMGKKAEIICNSEPPLLSRMQLLNRVPLIEIWGKYWSCGADKEISTESLCELLRTKL